MKFLDDVVGKSSTISSLPDKRDKNIDDIDSAIDEPLLVMQPQTLNTSTVIEQSASDVFLSPSQQQPNVSLSPSQQQPNVSLSPSQQQPNVSLSPSQQQPKAKKSKNCNNISDVKEVILSALESDSKRNPDAVDGFFLQIGDRVRALPARERAQFEMQVLALLFEFEQKFSLF
ncbi:uncharacterized protein LOC112465716 [Temnothorax curvispinosus]|uniref:Uncharacterized protein LOC112465716 n=1 Tax=Temnothorax curvispinosus TaxID=300111 RepID=A0A6J1R2G1_9HYME|nr:uncharacterized protein LOC112465716 [Temnothorax curvispinosus]